MIKIWYGIPLKEKRKELKSLLENGYQYFYENNKLFGFGISVIEYSNDQISMMIMNEFLKELREIHKSVFIDFIKYNLIGDKSEPHYNFPMLFIFEDE